MTDVKSRQQIFTDFQTELQTRVPTLTDTSEGSIVDGESGAASFVVSELSRLIVGEFAKTFFDSANGPEVTGGADDLQTLAVDHFGPDFGRPTGSPATGSVTFSRATTSAGNVTITAGTVLSTAKNANGIAQTFTTDTTGTMTGTSLSLTVTASAVGSTSNAQIGKVNLLNTALTDSTVVVTNAAAMSGGTDVYGDTQYRDYIRGLVSALRAAVKAAIEAAAKTVPGIITATLIESEVVVMPWNIATSAAVVSAVYFRVPFCVVYIADINGVASVGEIASARVAIDGARAAGVYIDVQAALASSLAWTATIVLNPAGPNYATFLAGTFTLLTDAMAQYIRTLPIGTGFDVTLASNAIRALYGAAGTNDLTSFTTTVPGASVAGVTGTKLIPGTMTVS